MFTNHGGGFVYATLAETYMKIPRGNRLRIDNSGRWIDSDEMGHDDTPIEHFKEKSRYSHSANLMRPYWW